MFAFAVEPIEGRLARAHPLGAARPARRRGASRSSRTASGSRPWPRCRQRDRPSCEELIPQLPFQADGVVIKVDRLDLHAELGVRRRARAALGHRPEVRARGGRHPAGGHPDQRRAAPARSIPGRCWSRSRSSGVTVSAATLHNEDLIAQKDIRDRRPGRGHPRRRGDPPGACGRCSRVWIRPRAARRSACRTAAPPAARRSSVRPTRRCATAPTCPAPAGCWRASSTSPRATRWTSAAWATSGCASCSTPSSSTNVADLYDLTADRLVELDRFAEQSAEQLVAAIAASKERPLSILLFGLGIRHVGKTVAQLLARRFGTMARADEGRRSEPINDVPGRRAAPSPRRCVAFFGEPRNQELIARLGTAGLTFTEPRAAAADGPLVGQDLRAHGHPADAVARPGHRADRGRRRAGGGQREQEDRRGRGGRRRRAASSRRRRPSASRSSTRPNSCVASAARPNFEHVPLPPTGSR